MQTEMTMTSIDNNDLAAVTGGTVIHDPPLPPDRTNCGFGGLGDLVKETPWYLQPRQPTYGELTGKQRTRRFQ